MDSKRASGMGRWLQDGPKQILDQTALSEKVLAVWDLSEILLGPICPSSGYPLGSYGFQKGLRNGKMASRWPPTIPDKPQTAKKKKSVSCLGLACDFFGPHMSFFWLPFGFLWIPKGPQEWEDGFKMAPNNPRQISDCLIRKGVSSLVLVVLAASKGSRSYFKTHKRLLG